jgi:hypothetical protein
MKQKISHHLSQYAIYYLILILWFATFFNNLNSAFFYDDYGQFVENANLHNIKNFYNVVFCGLRQIRVIQNVSFAIDYYFTQLDPTSYHVTNNLLHLLNAMLVLSFLKKIKAIPINVTYITVLIYLVHPIQVDSVTYIMGRTTLLQNLFLFSIFNEVAKEEHRSRLKIVLLLIISFFVKESCTLIPFIIVLFDYHIQPSLFNTKIFKREYVFYFGTILLYFPIYHIFKDSHQSAYDSVVGFKLYWPVHEYFLTQGFYNFFYVFLFLNPSFHVIYHEVIDFNWLIGLVGAFNWLLIISILVYLFKNGKRYNVFTFFLLYFLILHGTTNSILQLVNPFAEYRLGVSLLPMILGFSYIIYLLSRKFNKYIIPSFFILYFAFFTHLINDLYHSPHTPWIYAKQQYPKSLIIDMELARMEILNNNYGEARKILERTIIENPNIITQVHLLKYIIGHTYYFEGEFQKAVDIYLLQLKEIDNIDSESVEKLLLSLFYLKQYEDYDAVMKFFESNLRNPSPLVRVKEITKRPSSN